MTVLEPIRALLTAADCHQIHAAYAGIGARKTPPYILAFMTRIATKLDALGWVLRSGGADGADAAFENGATQKATYLPWPWFNGRDGALVARNRPSARALEIAPQYHPNWKNLSEAAQKLHARNVHQILGADCNSPCSMVICWTPDGSTEITTARTGGTGQAIRIAAAHKVPIFNLQRDDHRAAWEEVLR
jgi:hypothetical protein